MNLDLLYIPVSWVLLRWHQVLVALGMPTAGGWTWTLSIMFLVITARLLLFRLFVKQVRYQRAMQRIQPEITKLREQHKNDKQELNRQIMVLQQSEGLDPLAGCLPMLLQLPVFIGLYHVVRHISNSIGLCQAASSSHLSRHLSTHLLTLYTFSRAETCDAARATIFSSPLAASFHDGGSVIASLGGDPSSTRLLLVIVLILSAGATFATQVVARSHATIPPGGMAATVQKLILYVIPFATLASGLVFDFPLGVLLYWFTSNFWTLGQQAYVVRFHPPTGDAERAPGHSGPPTPAPA